MNADREALERVLALCRDQDGRVRPGESNIPVGAILAAVYTDPRPPTEADIKWAAKVARELQVT
jgi:hypothetical protein